MIFHHGISNTEFRETIIYIILCTLFLLTQTKYIFSFRASALYFCSYLTWISSQENHETVKVSFLYPVQLFFLTQIQECIYILLTFIECLLYAKHDAEPYEKHRIVGLLSILKEPIYQ